jgi:hypothetical protein
MKDYYNQQKRTMTRSSKKQRPRKSGFKVRFALFPLSWAVRLRKAGVSGATYALAIAILIENFKRDQMAVKEIVLSRQVTGLSRHSQRRAVKNLVKLHLIKVRWGIGKAIRVMELYYL